MWQPSEPLAEQTVDTCSGQTVADGLQPFWAFTRKHAVVQRRVLDARAFQLSFGVFVPVQAQFAVVREIRTELQKEWSEVAVYAIEIVVVHEGSGLHNPRVLRSGLRVVALLSSIHATFFLCLA